MSTINLIKSDSSDVFKIKVKEHPELDKNWECKLAVVEKLESLSGPIIEKSLTKTIDNSAFEGLITPAESSTLEIKTYYLVFQVQNLTIDYRREIQYKLKVAKEGIL